MYPLSIVLGSALQIRVMEAPTAKLTFSGLGEMTTTGLTVQERKLVRKTRKNTDKIWFSISIPTEKDKNEKKKFKRIGHTLRTVGFHCLLLILELHVSLLTNGGFHKVLARFNSSIHFVASLSQKPPIVVKCCRGVSEGLQMGLSIGKKVRSRISQTG